MIDVQGLNFSYDGKKDVIREVTFEVKEGEIFGFLGPSGAGKSTLQKILSGILRNYRGRIRVLDTEIKNRKESFYEQIGMVFEFPNFYSKFTAKENLDFFSSLYKNNALDALPLMERVGLAEDLHKKVSGYSKGMKMRLAFVRAILHQPALLFLDEPASGLDPGYARIIKEMIFEQKKEGRTIILTTHNMHDAEELCDRVAFVVDGRIMALDTPHALRAGNRDVTVSYTYRSGQKEEIGSAMLSGLHRDNDFMSRLNAGVLTGIHSREPSLEDVFIELTGRCLK